MRGWTIWRAQSDMMMPKPNLQVDNLPGDEIDLGRVVANFWAGKRIIAGGMAAAVFATIYYLMTTAPTYEADAMLQITSGEGSMLALPSSMSDLLGSNNASTLAEIEILKSRQVLGRAVADLNLDWQAEPLRAPLIGNALVRYDLPVPELGPLSAYARRGDNIKLSFLDVPSDWLSKPMRVEKIGEAAFAITLPDGTRHEGAVRTLLTVKESGFAIQIAQLDGPVGRAFTVRHLTEMSATARLLAGLTVEERGRQTGIVDVRLRGRDPVAVAVELNAVLRAYVEQNVSKSSAEAQKSLAFVESQLPIVESAVKAADEALNAYRSAQKSVDLGFEMQSLLTEATATEGQLRELALEEEELKEKYTPSHPVYRQLLDQRRALTERLDELQAAITQLPETQREIVNLTRNLEVSQAAYFELMNRAQELRVLSSSQIGSVRIIDDAATKPIPIAPLWNQLISLSIVGGFLLGIGGVMLRRWLHRGIEAVGEIERLGLPVFATINLYKSNAKAPDDRQLLVAQDDPDDIVVEAFRSLRTSLHFGMLDAKSKSLVVTSAAPGAGKSFVSVNLACVAAQAGQRVCLIDADMRRGTQRKYFGISKGLIGLADHLSESTGLEQVLRPSGVPNLSLILTGALPPNPSELLMRDRLKQLIAALDERFDLVIFDAPPVLAVTDASILGQQAGSVIAVARHLVTPAVELEAVNNTLHTAGVPLKGVILNAFNPRLSRSGGSYNYRYGYSKRYAYSRNDDR